ncbi:hypothetical protein CVU37_08265 [candidate division BRC1 bacterium HGW-BRC1-1]|nr:MAG: hypothetical protein CVU37_08265 [candidate division BRC1 bacterium HGW-BRC1-1]
MRTSDYASPARRHISIQWLILLMLLAISAQSHALGILIPRVVTDQPVVLGDVEVRVEINANIALTRIVQDFRNPNPRDLEADFFFPVPRGANVTDFILMMNGKRVPGEVIERDKARAIYEDIVRRAKDPGLLEWVDSNIFKVRVYPVPANGTQRIELEFAQPLEADQGLFRYLLPLKAPKSEGKANNESPVKFSIVINSDEAVANISSPTHPIKVDTNDPRKAKITPPDDKLASTGDFILYYGRPSSDPVVNIFATRIPPGDGYFSLMISPPTENSQTTESAASDVTFVVDTSGSMLEEGKMDQARKALVYCLAQLSPEQRFNIVRFSTGVESFRKELVPATPENIAEARQMIGTFKATGGTNISGALETALDASGNKEAKRIHTVVLLTDGQPTVGIAQPDQLIAKVAQLNTSSLRIFTFGVGFDVNTRLLDGLADETRAASEYTKPGQDIELPVARFFDKINRPAITNLKLAMPSAETYDLYPAQLPDLFYGTQLTVFGRYKNAGPTSIMLEGMRGGQPVKYSFEKTLPDSQPENSHVEKLWGTRKIGFLLDEIRKNGEKSETKDEVIQLARKYGVVTPYTSYLVVEDEPQRRVAAQPIPASDNSVFYRSSYKTSTRAAAPASSMAGLQSSSGESAVRTAQALRSMKEVTVNEMRTDKDDSVVSLQTISGHSFVLKDGVWTDTSLDESPADVLPEVKIKYLSNAWFAAARINHSLKEIFTLGDKIRIKLPKCVVTVGDQGESDLSTLSENLLKPTP